MFCCMLLYVHSSFANILMGKRELLVLFSLTSWCLVIVVWLFLVVPSAVCDCVISLSNSLFFYVNNSTSDIGQVLAGVSQG